MIICYVLLLFIVIIKLLLRNSLLCFIIMEFFIEFALFIEHKTLSDIFQLLFLKEKKNFSVTETEINVIFHIPSHSCQILTQNIGLWYSPTHTKKRKKINVYSLFQCGKAAVRRPHVTRCTVLCGPWEPLKIKDKHLHLNRD